MKVHIGIKSDAIQTRYSYKWLFGLMKRLGVWHLQLGGFFELPLLETGFFTDLRENAEKFGVRIKSVFTAHRETSGFFWGNRYLEKAARTIYEKFISAGKLLGADYVGSSAGAVPRDMMHTKHSGLDCYFRHMTELMHAAKDAGLRGLIIEVMSCSAEPPTFPSEIDAFMGFFREYHEKQMGATVPVYLLGDISHGYADQYKRVVHSNYELFEHSIPYMSEFHFKNTDETFSATFGFSEDEPKGIVDLAVLKKLIQKNDSKWPVEEVTGYLEHPGPKLGRDYSDYRLEKLLEDSVAAIKKFF